MLNAFIPNGMGKNKPINIAKNTLLLLVSTIISLVILELGIRVFIPQDKKITWIEMHERGFVMNQSGGSSFQEFGERRAEYKFTEQRLRTGISANQDSSAYKILAIGDSYTFGLLLDESDTYMHHLQIWADSSLSEPVLFLNAAVGGSGMADWPAWLDTFGSNIEPDMVLYFMNNNDVFRALSKNLFVLDNGELTSSQRWKPTSFSQKINTRNWYRYLQAHSELMNLIVKVLWKYAYFDDLTHSFDPQKTEVVIPDTSSFNPSNSYSLELSKSLIHSMESWCSENTCTFVLANTGYLDKSLADDHTYQTHQYYSESERPYLNIQSCVSEAVDGDYTTIQIPIDLHPNELGAQIIADCIAKQLPDFLPFQ